MSQSYGKGRNGWGVDLLSVITVVSDCALYMEVLIPTPSPCPLA